ncbi:hypothetical protein IC229_02970 [Spirosoma sp. BT702]|uniref:Uncharacterized protein n=1 Tax=Spirosoma profusum TaxID=2771354 RepID=A0A927AQ33_9BACT|nr:hypothetical protein [Spirosoma profusum]MBD2699583.1 hypothetical protein [Spirosoma profusum]
MLRLLFSFCISWLLVQPVSAQTTPKRLMIYNGYPSSFNLSENNRELSKVAASMAQYNYVVLGRDLEKAVHKDHVFTQNLMTNAATNSVRFYGYIDLGVTPPLQNHSTAEIETRILEWKAMGVDGIFFDDVEYDYGVSRARMNGAIQYAHAQSLSVVVNGNKPDEIFGQQINPTYNPTGAGTPIDSRDAYLSESFLISLGSYTNPGDWIPKAALVESYRQQLGFRIWSCTTNSLAQANATDTQVAPLFAYAWYGAWLYGHEATSWGEYEYSATEPNNGVAPFRPRPNPSNPGTAFVGPVRQSGNLLTRYTNTGRIQIDISNHVGAFINCTSFVSTGSGNWQTTSLWSSSRLPLACDVVTIQPGHIITLTGNAEAGQLLLRGNLRPSTYRLQFRIY